MINVKTSTRPNMLTAADSATMRLRVEHRVKLVTSDAIRSAQFVIPLVLPELWIVFPLLMMTSGVCALTFWVG